MRRRESGGRKFFEGTEANAIGLTEGAINGTGFGHTHFGVVKDQGRDIAGMGIAITDEAATLRGLIHRRLEDPEVLLGTAEGEDGLDMDTGTMIGLGQLE